MSNELEAVKVTYRDWCSCALMQWQKCNLCGEDRKMEHVDWEATAKKAAAELARLRGEIRAEALREAAAECNEIGAYGDGYSCENAILALAQKEAT